MKKRLLIALIVSQAFSLHAKAKNDYASLVNTLIGTDSSSAFSHGNKYPAVAVPNPMILVSPDMNPGNSTIYQYHACVYPGDSSCGAEMAKQTNPIKGFRLTHESSPWIGDFGDMDIMPLPSSYPSSQNPDNITLAKYGRFSHNDEIAKPYEYRVKFADSGIDSRVTTSRRAAYFSFAYPEPEKSDKNASIYIAFTLNPSLSSPNQIQWNPVKRTGFSGSNGHGANGSSAPANFRHFFDIRFLDSQQRSVSFSRVSLWQDGKILTPLCDGKSCHVTTSGALSVLFAFPRNPVINLLAGTSYVNTKQASFNRESELGKMTGNQFMPASFEEISASSRELWNQLLGRIAVTPNADAQGTKEMTAFYTALYHVLLFPYTWHECSRYSTDRQCDVTRNSDGSWKYVFHRSPFKPFMNGKNGEPIVYNGPMFSGEGFWDTARTRYSLLGLVYPDLASQYVNGWLKAYQDLGFLPEWPSLGAVHSMTGNYSSCVIADVYMRGVRGFDTETAFNAIYKAATVPGHAGYGRQYLADYLKYGYVPSNNPQSLTQTLDYAYADVCVANMAGALGKKDMETALRLRANKATTSVFDKNTTIPLSNSKGNVMVKGVFRAKTSSGQWISQSSIGGIPQCTADSNFCINSWWGPYTEGSAWQYLFAMPWQISGENSLAGKFASAYAGNGPLHTPQKALEHNLDLYFTTGSAATTTSFRPGWVHEMKEMPYTGLGQHAFNNQPVYGNVYAYNQTENPWKTQCIIRNIMNTERVAKDGYNQAYACFPAPGISYPATEKSTLKRPSTSSESVTRGEVMPMVLFGDGPDGLLGDEDTGALSAWLIQSAMGLYPVPGTDQLQIGSPLFRQINITVPASEANNFTERTLLIKAPENSRDNIFVQGISINGKIVDLKKKEYQLRTSDMYPEKNNGKAVLQFNMGKLPEKQNN